MQIAVFDSGLGGMTVLHDLKKRMPDEDYLYYADTAHVPYGQKPKEEVKKYIFEAMDFIIRQGVKAIVIACNTATSVAVQELRDRYPQLPIIGMEPAVKPALDLSEAPQRVLVTGHLTCRNGYQVLAHDRQLRLASGVHAEPLTSCRYLLFDAGRPVTRASELLAGVGSVLGEKL